MIQAIENIFVLSTDNTTYCFRLLESGQLEHLYYGKRISISSAEEVFPLMEYHSTLPGMATVYSKQHPTLCLEDLRLEISSTGKGDTRESFVEIIHTDGSLTTDFIFERAEISCGVPKAQTLPSSHDSSGSAQTLTVSLRDKNDPALVLELIYRVFEDCDVISRSAVLLNVHPADAKTRHTVTVTRLMSTMLDLEMQNQIWTTFTGAWAREMERSDIPVSAGTYINESTTGASSNKANPFVMLSWPSTTEDTGCCLGINLIYSANHMEALQVSSYGKLRLLAGINPKTFCWKLEGGQRLETPEAVMTFSAGGYNGLSNSMHRFVEEHIVNANWAHTPRPIVLNSWEAFYHDINEDNLLELARIAARTGVELFVIDDGWFGSRDNDTTSLGDWEVNPAKFPHGMHAFCKKLTDLGLEVGIWVEPEAINTKSKLYQSHPEWTMEIPGQEHAEGRYERLLDLSRTDVQDFVIQSVSDLLESAPFTYLKWDMNRMCSDVFSQKLLPEQQQELFHRYILGLYRCMRILTERFDYVLFEGCSAGGNRFDLGILSYFPQIWASDCTDSYERARIQTSLSYAYPQSCISCHVSASHNHQTMRKIPLETRFAIAAFGAFGYEWNLLRLPEDDLREIKRQVDFYKKYREVFQFGNLQRTRSFSDRNVFGAPSNICEWTCVSADKTCAIGMRMHKLACPNAPNDVYYPKGLDKTKTYRITAIDDAGCRLSDSFTAPGDILLQGGIRLPHAYLPRHNKASEYHRDFSSELYLFVAVQN